jgi:hypothetical protein
LTALAVTLLKPAVIAVIIVIIQPDRDTVAPDPVDFDIEREELLPAANCDPGPAILRHAGIVEADRRELLRPAPRGKVTWMSEEKTTRELGLTRRTGV